MMESGINADQNFYSRRQLPQSPGQHQQLHYRSSPYNSPPPPPTDSTIPPQPPKLSLLTTSNLQAISSNGFANGVIGAGEPDEFYRDYRGMQQSPNRYTDLPANTTTTTMTASTPGTRQTPFSLRANGNGTTPKHPSIPLTRNNIKPSYRSASSPLDDRQKLGLAKSTPALNGYAKAQQPSVKDLLKRFDQNNESSATTTRKPVPRTSTMKDAAIGGPGYARDRPGYLPRSANMQPGPARAGSVTREPGLARVKSPSSARPTQRNRFATEDQHSNNTLSSVARTHRPRITTAVNPSKSMSPISPSTTVSPGSTEKRPLFGEVVPSEQGVLNIGFGIPTATRRISDSSLRPPGSTRRRSRSDLDVSPSSPTAWYLGVTPDLDNVNPNKARKVVHNRAHSDFADNQVNILNRTGDHPSFLVLESPDTYKPRDSDARKSASRLPVSTNRQSNPSDGSSPESTRSNSPFATKATTNAKLRKPEPQPWSPAGRAKTPTSRAITPSHSTSRYRARTPEKLPTSNSSLKAYISAPPPKLSPPLRSSRPRQPVSSAATTANSRQKSGERSGSPLRSGMKLTRNNTLEDSRARKILDAGPVDFAARRARIQRAYTKSIQESEQKEIRAANLRRLTERHAKNGGVEERRREKTESASLPMQSSPEATPEISESLHISTSFSRPSVPVPSEERRDVREEDSPTLGMPGTFVDDDEPPVSAVSNVSGTTQIENEAQTEAARLALMPSEEKPEPETLSNLTYNASPDLSRNETGNDGGSIRVLLEATPVEEHKVHQEYIARDHYPQGAFQQDDDLTYNQAASNDAVISHKGTTIEFPVIETHLESSNDSDVHINKSNSDSMGDSTGQLAKSQADLEAEAYYSQVPSQNGKVEFDETPRLELPMLRTALSSSPTRSVEESEHEYLHTPFTDVGYESSDAAGHVDTSERYDPYGPSYDYRRHLAAGSYKTSRNSGWTDETVETDEYSTQEDHTYSQDDAKKPTPPPKVTIHELPTRTPPLPPKPDAYSSPEPSPALPLDKVATSLIGQFELPPLTTHNGFGLAYDEDPIYSVPSAPYWSEYSPPAATGEIEELKEAFPTQNTQPQPAQSLYSRRESSMYQSSHNDASRNAESRRTSDDVYSLSASTSTPRSSTQISVEELSATQSTDAVTTSTSTSFEPKQSNSQQSKPLQIDLTLLFPKSAQAAAKKRMLFKRSMIINELIDTESLYLKDMEVIKEIYKATADAVQQLEDSDVKCIFRNVEDIIEFTKTFLRELKAAGANVYLSKGRSKQNKANPSTQDKANASTQDKSNSSTDDKINSTTENKSEPATEDTSLIAALEKYKKLTGKAGVDEFEKVAIQAALEEEVKNQENEEKDRETFIGKGFGKHLDRMQQIYTEFLLHSEAASHRLSVLEKEAAVKVWLSECTIAAKDLTQAWSLDALLVKPVQRITRYQLILKQLLDETPADHPDHDALQATADGVLNLLSNINKMKERIQTVAKIVGRKRKESDVRGGLTKAFGRRIEKGFNTVRPNDDEVYTQLHDKFGEDYLRLQVVLRDVEYYTRHVTNWVNDFLRYLSSIELVMRMSASPYPELESKWARYNVHMRDMHTIALKEHLEDVQDKIIEPFKSVIKLYDGPELAMQKRDKRRLDWEKGVELENRGKKVEGKHKLQCDEYEALNETLKLELPKLGALTEKLGNLCMAQFVVIQRKWFDTWQFKVSSVLEEYQFPKDEADIINKFQLEYSFNKGQAYSLGIINGTFGPTRSRTRAQSSSTNEDRDQPNHRPSNLANPARGSSFTGDQSPGLQTPESTKRYSGQLTITPFVPMPPQQLYVGPQSQFGGGHSRAGSGSPATPDPTSASRLHGTNLTRPNTSRSYTSDNGVPRISTEYSQHRRESGSTYNSASNVDGPLQQQRPFSGIFHSAMPLNDGVDDSQRSSRASSRDQASSGGYNVLYLAASLFEFNISATKTEAGYPYLTYSAGEIFDVIGEKGELWLAKNQDDPSDQVGWIWSKHFARLASD